MKQGKTYAIIGCQHAHIEIFIREMQELGYCCIGLYERDNHRLAEAVAGKYGISLVRDMEVLLDSDAEIVGCASINSEKIGVIEQCEARGKSIMLDKPAVTSDSGLKRLKAVLERGHIQVGMLLTERFHPAIYTLKQQIDQGKLGEIVTIAMRKPHRLNAESRPDWFFSKKQCGGIVIDLLVHDFDLLRWLTGQEMQSVDGYVGKTILPEHPTFYNTASLQVMMSGHVVSQLHADWHTPQSSWTWGDGRIFVTGTEGFAELRLEGDPLIRSEALLLQLTNEEAAASLPLVKPRYSITEDFLHRVEGRVSSITHEDILKASEAALVADRRATVFESFTKGGGR